MKNIVLDSNDIKNKISRISFEIIEKNYDKEELVVVGLLPNGRYISEEICDIINTNSDISTSAAFFDIDSSNNKITCEDPKFNFKSFKDKSIVVIDDVSTPLCELLYTGTPFILIDDELEFLNLNVKKKIKDYR